MGALNKMLSRVSGHSVATASGNSITIISREQAQQTDAELRSFRKQHRWDLFMASDNLDRLDSAIQSGDAEKEAAVGQQLIQENSPYAEVRNSVPPTDVDDMPVSTIRAWVLGAVLCTCVTACNVLLNMRAAPVTISSTVVQLISYPLGVAWAKYVPNRQWSVLGTQLQLSPGPFNVKEHTIITMMTAAGSGPSYAISILLAQEHFYGQNWGWAFHVLVIVSTQALGFGIAGIARRFLVWPSSMVWPTVLVTTTVMHSLHDHTPSDPLLSSGWQLGRYAFFLIVASATFCWHWVPQVLAQCLQHLTFPVWIAPENAIVNQLFGGRTGLGIMPLTLDWGVVTGFFTSPLQAPAFALWNMGAGAVVALLSIVGLGWAGPEFFRYLPLSANDNYDNRAKVYNTSLILNHPETTFNQTKYEAYSPILISPAFAMSYGMGFAALVATITHVALFFGPDVWRRARSARSEEPDVHLKLMRKYKEAPGWWFIVIFLISFAFGLLASQIYDTHLPWWAYIMAIVIGAALFIPIGMVMAITTQHTGLNIVTEMIFGYMLPGRPVAMMLFKSWGFMLAYNGLTYVSDMKVGQYIKVPPRAMFAAQAFAVIWLSIVQVAVYNFLMGNIKDICAPDQPQGITCPNARTFYNASVIWGVLGPRKMFGAGALFSWINWYWLIGFICPAIQYLIARRYPRSWVRYIMFPTIFGVTSYIPPATTYNIFVWLIVGLTFNVVIYKLYRGWWLRYNYTLSGALDIGFSLCASLVALSLGLSGAVGPNWWGNTIDAQTLDYQRKAVTKVLGANDPNLGPAVW